MLSQFSLETLDIVVVLIRVVLSVLHLESATPYRHELSFKDLDRVWLRWWLWQTERLVLPDASILINLPRPHIQLKREVACCVVVWATGMLDKMIYFGSVANISEVHSRKSRRTAT